MIINIIVGAHKTGTTFIQKQLNKNFKTLIKNKIFFLSLQKVRTQITNKISNNQLPNLETIIEPYKIKEIETVILFDENIVGPFNDLSRNFGPFNYLSVNRLYPFASKRIKKLKVHFSKFGTVKTFMIVRNFGDYFVSAYTEFLRKGKYLDFENFFDFKSDLTWKIDGVERYILFEELFNDLSKFYNLILEKNIILKNFKLEKSTLRSKYSLEAIRFLKQAHSYKIDRSLIQDITTFIDHHDDVNIDGGIKIEDISLKLKEKLALNYQMFLEKIKK